MSEGEWIAVMAIGAIILGLLIGIFVLGDGSDIMDTVNRYG